MGALFNVFFDERTVQPGALLAFDENGKGVRDLLPSNRTLMFQDPMASHWVDLIPPCAVSRSLRFRPGVDGPFFLGAGSALRPGKYRLQLICNDKLTADRLLERGHKDYVAAQREFDGPIKDTDVLRSNVVEFEIESE